LGPFAVAIRSFCVGAVAYAALLLALSHFEHGA
jgi:hypothetical protein